MSTSTKSPKTKGTSGRKHHYHFKKNATQVESGITRQVVVNFCPECACDFKAKSVHIQTTHTQFQCPDCGVLVTNTRINRCPGCQILYADSDTFNAHIRGGCNTIH